jgi:uncharacterized membrane protein
MHGQRRHLPFIGQFRAQEGRAERMKSDRRLPHALFVVLVLVGFLQTRHTAMTLPPVVAVHFVKGGAPNGWQTQSQMLMLALVLLGVCVLVGFGIPRIIAAIPVALVNLPNKTYWFAPERREQTIDFFKTWFAWFGCALLAFMIFVNHLVYEANQRQPKHLDTGAFLVATFTFLVFVAIYSMRIILRFGREPQE